MKNQITNEESVTLQSIVSVDGTSRMEVMGAIKASKALRGQPGALLARAVKAGLIKKENTKSGVFYYLINGGENTETAPSNNENEVSQEVKDMIWEIAENKKEVFKAFPEIFGGIRSIEYDGKAVTMKHSKKGKLFYNFLEKEGVEMVKMIYYACKGMGIIK